MQMPPDFENELLLITNAGSMEAAGLLPQVAQRWKRIRLQCPATSNWMLLQQSFPDAEIVVGDIADNNTAKNLMSGVSVCILITEPSYSRRSEHGYYMIDAAESNVETKGQFKHMLYCSTIYPNSRALTSHTHKGHVEEALLDSELPFTVVQPNVLMETPNILAVLQGEDQTIWTEWDPGCKFSHTATLDLGLAMANIIAERDVHMFATYQLCSSPFPVSYYDVATILTARLGTTIIAAKSAMQLPAGGCNRTEERERQTNYARDIHTLNKYGLPGNSNVMRMLIRKEPTSWVDYVDWGMHARMVMQANSGSGVESDRRDSMSVIGMR